MGNIGWKRIEEKGRRGIIFYYLFPLHLPLMYLLLKQVKWGEIILSTKLETGKISKLVFVCDGKDEWETGFNNQKNIRKK